jgi:hypothetical protein
MCLIETTNVDISKGLFLKAFQCNTRSSAVHGEASIVSHAFGEEMVESWKSMNPNLGTTTSQPERRRVQPCLQILPLKHLHARSQNKMLHSILPPDTVMGRPLRKGLVFLVLRLLRRDPATHHPSQLSPHLEATHVYRI